MSDVQEALRALPVQRLRFPTPVMELDQFWRWEYGNQVKDYLDPILLIMVELISLKFLSPAQIGFIDRVILGGFNSHINEVKDQTFENIIGVV